MCKISIVVPIYNVEKYLPECLDSIIGQNLKDIEIILLNDGSTDNSLDICKRYAAQDKRISVYTHKNIGLGPTRNRGIRLSHGEYIAFVDSDDYISSDGLEKMYKKAKKTGADIVCAETVVFTEGQSEEKIRTSLASAKDIQMTEKNAEDFYVNHYFTRIYSHNAWDKIYKRSFVIEHNLLFGDNKKIFAEDNWFQLQALYCHPSIAYVSHKFYWYRQQDNSIMHKPKKNLIIRHGRMIADYQKLISANPKRIIERKVCSIIAADVLTMEALNSRIIGRKRKEFLKAVSKIQSVSALTDAITDVNRIHGASLYKNNVGKTIYLYLIGLLYRIKCYKISHIIVWLLYFSR